MTRIGLEATRTTLAAREVEDVEQARAQRAQQTPIADPNAHGTGATANDFRDVTGLRVDCAGPPPMPGNGSAAVDYAALTADDTPATTATAPATNTGGATATPATAGATTPPAKRVESSGLEIPRQEKIDTLAQALPADQAARLRELASAKNVTQESIDAAYASVLEARKTPGQKDLAFSLTPTREETVNMGEGGMFTQTVQDAPVSFGAKVEIGAGGTVNGKALAVDRLAGYAADNDMLSGDAKRAALRESGLSEQWIMSASQGQQEYALAKMRDAASTPGNHALDFGFTVTGYEGESGHAVHTDVPGKVNLKVGEDRVVNGGVLPVEQKIAEKIAFENKEWPGGTPESREKRRIEDTNLEVPQNEKLATLSQVLSTEDAARMRALVDTGNVPAHQIDAAYASVLEARKTPGNKDVGFSLNTERTETYEAGESGPFTQRVSDPPVSFTAKMNVGADGTVNGKALGVDELARLSSQVSTVPGEAKDAALREAGLSESWVQMATPGEKEFALVKMRQAAFTPGAHALDLSFTRETITGGDSEMRSTHTEPGKITLNVDADGKVNGKTPHIERTLATQLTMERLPMAERRQLLASLGVPADGVKNASPEESADVLTRISLRTQTPGEQQFDIRLGGREYIMGLKVGPEGQIEGAGAVEKPPKPSGWKKWLGPVLTIASFVFPPAAPFLQAANAALAVANGAKGLGLVAAVAGGFGGFVNGLASLGGVSSGVASAAATASTIATYAGAANGLYQGVKNGDWLSAVASGASLVGHIGGADLGDNLGTVQNVSQVAGYAARVANGDFEGLLAEGIGRGIEAGRASTQTPTATQADVRRVDNALDAAEDAASAHTFHVDLGGSGVRLGDGGTSGVRLGTGDDGASLVDDTAGDVTPVATQADVRRIDNEIRATQRTPQEVREDFDRAFAAARRGGETTFLFDKGDGRGAQPYTTGTREEAAARVAGGSTNGYRDFLRQSGLRDSEAGLAAYRDSLTPRLPEVSFGQNLDQLPNVFTTFGVPVAGDPVIAAADAGRALAASTDISALQRFGNSTVNTLRVLSDSAAALVPGTDSNRAVTSAITQAAESLWNAGRAAVDDPAGAARSVERAVGTIVRTAMDPREWQSAGAAIVQEVLRPFGDLATTLGKDPNAIVPGELAIAAFGAATSFNPRGAAGGVARLGDLRPHEVSAIQDRARDLGESVFVVGSAARGTRRNLDTDLPLHSDFGGKAGTRSDIDYAVRSEAADAANGLQFPDADGKFGVLSLDYINLRSGPAIEFRPDGTVRYFNQGDGAIPLNDSGQRAIDRRGIPTAESPNAAPAGSGAAANGVGRTRELDAAAYFNRVGYDARVSNVEVNARFGGTEIDVDLTTPNGRYAVLVGGDAKAMRNGQLDEAAVRESLDRYYRARDVATDPDGPYRNSGAGAIMAFPAGTDPRVIARFQAELGASNVLVFTPPPGR